MKADPPTPDEQAGAGRTLTGLGAVESERRGALQTLGAMPELQRAVSEIPDARERLAYVGGMTETAAHKVLNLVDGAQPRCRKQAKQAHELAETLQRNAADPALSLEHARRMLTLCARYVSGTALFAEQQNAVLTDVLLAQDFQDLSGQVIKKVIDVITRTEQQLVQILADSPIALKTSSAAPSLSLAGAAPVVASLEGPQTPDKALAQDDVDNLLAALGF